MTKTFHPKIQNWIERQKVKRTAIKAAEWLQDHLSSGWHKDEYAGYIQSADELYDWDLLMQWDNEALAEKMMDLMDQAEYDERLDDEYESIRIYERDERRAERVMAEKAKRQAHMKKLERIALIDSITRLENRIASYSSHLEDLKRELQQLQ